MDKEKILQIEDPPMALWQMLAYAGDTNMPLEELEDFLVEYPVRHGLEGDFELAFFPNGELVAHMFYDIWDGKQIGRRKWPWRMKKYLRIRDCNEAMRQIVTDETLKVREKVEMLWRYGERHGVALYEMAFYPGGEGVMWNCHKI